MIDTPTTPPPPATMPPVTASLPYTPNSSTDRLLPRDPLFQRHHVIPIELWNQLDVLKQLSFTDVQHLFDLSNGEFNGMYLDYHSGSHPMLGDIVRADLKDLANLPRVQALISGTSADPAADRSWLAGEVANIANINRVRLSDAVMSDLNPDGTVKQGGLGRLVTNGSDSGLLNSPEYDAVHAATLNESQLEIYKREIAKKHNERIMTTELSADQSERMRVAKAYGGQHLAEAVRDSGFRDLIDSTRAEARARGIAIGEDFALSRLSEEAQEAIAQRTNRAGAASLIKYAVKHPGAVGKLALRKAVAKLVPGVNVVDTISDVVDVANVLYENRYEISRTFADVAGFYTSVYRSLTTSDHPASSSKDTPLFAWGDLAHGTSLNLRPSPTTQISTDLVIHHLYVDSKNASVRAIIDGLRDLKVITPYANPDYDEFPPAFKEVYDNAAQILSIIRNDGRFVFTDGLGDLQLNGEGGALFNAGYLTDPAKFADLMVPEIVVTASSSSKSRLELEEREYADGSKETILNGTLNLSDTKAPLLAYNLKGLLLDEGLMESVEEPTVIEISDRRMVDATGQEIVRKSEINVIEKGAFNTTVRADSIAQIFGSNLARLFGVEDELLSRVASATTGELAKNIVQELDDLFMENSSVGFDDFGNDLKGAAIGAVSSLLTAELFSGIGLDGIAGEVGNIVVSSVIGNIANNIVSGAKGAEAFQGIVDLSQIANALGSFVGSALASKIVNFDTVGGQLGSAIGSAVGGYALGSVFAGFASGSGISGAIASLGFAAGPLGAAVGAFLGFVLGGLIGSVFGGTPRSGADVEWDATKGSFSVTNVYAKKGGSKDAARSMATTAANMFNAVLSATGGTLIDPEAVQAGNYGMRKKDFVYRPISTRDKNAITQRYSGEDGAQKLINYGVYQGLTDPQFQVAGGDIFVKRALYASLALAERAGDAGGDFAMEALLGDFTVAKDYGFYFANADTINGLIGLMPDTVFSVSWAATVARGIELGLNRRSASDWTGGYAAWLDYAPDGKIDQRGLSVSGITADFDASNGERFWLISSPDIVSVTHVGYIKDTVRASDLTQVQGTVDADAIDLRSGKDLSGAAIDVAATVDGGDGNDTIHASDLGDNLFGGMGDDTLHGGRLDDWLLGGDGNDVLDAGGAAAGTLGGDGNYLNGGAGNDTLRGREGSDWLEGGEGADVLAGDAGDDILAGGAGDGDDLQGGAGSDQYLFRKGDGADVALDDPGEAGGTDPVSARIAAIAAGSEARDWTAGGIYSENNAPHGGEDSLVFGAGIGLEDVQLVRGGGGIAGTTGNDLIVQLTTLDTNGNRVLSGDRLLMRDWFNSYKKVEWLVFADGQAIRIGDFTSFIVGTAGSDVIIGTAGRDFAVGGAGDDWMWLLGGDDVGIGGQGKDWLSGDGDDDLLVGGADDDRVMGGTGNDVLSGDAGADDLYGGTGRDILAGGKGSGDIVVGAAGDDIFRYSRGDGRDTIADDYSATWETIWQNGYVNGYVRDALNRVLKGEEVVFDGTNWVGDVYFDVQTQKLSRLIAAADGSFGKDATLSGEQGDALEFALGINIQDVMLAQDGYDLVLGVASENSGADFWNLSDQIRLSDWYRSTNRPIERFVFVATGALNTETTQLIGGSDGDDEITGTSSADWITGNGGDDTLDGAVGDDVLSGNAGSDALRGGVGDDILYGGAGNDILDGGADADILSGGDGEDTASYAGSSAVAVYLSSPHVNYGDAVGDTYFSIENLTGSANNDYALAGDDGDNVIAGGAGSDKLFGGEGDDTYVWNAWDLGDTIDDRAFEIDEVVGTDGQLKAGYTVTKWESTGVLQDRGSKYFYWRLQITGPDGEILYDYDRYTPSTAAPPQPTPAAYIQDGWKNGFSRVLNGVSNGQQVVRQRFDDTADGGEDTLEMGASISLSDLSFELDGSDLVVRYHSNEWNYVRIKGQANANSAVEWLQLNDGLAVSLASLMVAASDAAVVGTAEDNLLVGRELVGAVDTLEGGAGNDVLSGMAGNDILRGGEGDDVIEGGAGADQIDGGTQSAATVTGWGDTVRYVASASAVSIDLRNTTTSQSGGDAAGDILTSIENVVGSEAGDDQIIGDDGGNRLFGLGGNDVLSGLDGDDVLVGDDGDDQLFGGYGDDSLSGGAGNDYLEELWGSNILDGGAGDDVLVGGGYRDQLLGGDGNDQLDGGDDADVMVGGAGDDELMGGWGGDQLTGGVGNDMLSGGSESDVYNFDAHSGQDLIVDDHGQNSIVFDQSVTFEQLWLVRMGDDLIVSVIGGTAAITVKDYFGIDDPTRIYSISTTTHTLFLNHAGPLVGAMTQAAATTPASLPDAIRAQLATYWHAGGKARPTASPIMLTIDEDNPTATVPLGVVDHDDNVEDYVIKTQAVHGTVTLDLETRQFVYTPHDDFNGEDLFTILATDEDNQAVEVQVKVTVNPINDAPRDLMIEGDQVIEIGEVATGSETQPGSAVARFKATDIEGDALTYTLVNDAQGAFAITHDGLLIVSDASKLNFEQLSYQDALTQLIRVQARDALGAVVERDFEITVLDRNEANSLPASYAMAIDENLAPNKRVGAVRATDIDFDDYATGWQRYYFWDGTTASEMSADGRYRINIESGEIRTVSVPDYEAGASASYTVIARDNAGQPGFNQVSTTVTISINDVNEPNSLPAALVMAVDENVALGTVVGMVVAGDVDDAGTVFAQQRYYFWDGSAISDTSADGRFRIDAVTGRVHTNAALDYEAGGIAGTYEVVARDNAGGENFHEARTSVTIAINNVNEAPDIPVLTEARGMLDEFTDATSNDRWIARFALSDPDGTVPTLRLASNPESRFQIVGNEVRFAGNYSPDFETLYNDGLAATDSDGDGLLEITLSGSVEAHDGSLSSAPRDFSIVVEDVNEAPTDTTWAPSVAAIEERDHRGRGEPALVAIDLGSLGVLDPDIAGFPSSSYTYTVSDDRFEIIGNVLRLKLDTTDIDYETSNQITLTVTATDRIQTVNPGATPHSIARQITFDVIDRVDIFEDFDNLDHLVGQSGEDRIYGFEGDDLLEGLAGNDLIEGGIGNDRLLGGAGNDTLDGGEGADIASGGDGNDLLRGGANDVNTKDWLYGGEGNDALSGEAGDDILVGGNGADQLAGGDGFDVADYYWDTEGVAVTAGVEVDLMTPQANSGAAVGDSYSSIEGISGSIHDDVLRGDDNANALWGHAGNDQLVGRIGDDFIDGMSGNDSIYGDEGSDVLHGGEGGDTLYGGSGNDTLLGGAGNDRLFADIGNDYLEGGIGDDEMTGGDGDDSYVVGQHTGADTIFNYDLVGVDSLGFQDGVDARNLWFERSGDDLLITVIGGTSSVRVANWYIDATEEERRNYRIDFVGASDLVTIDAEGLADLLSGWTRPASTMEFETLMADGTFQTAWENYWSENERPDLLAISDQEIGEDETLQLTVTATDLNTAAENIQPSVEVISGGEVISSAGLVLGAPNANGERLLTITPNSGASGLARIRVQMTDTFGATATREFEVLVNPVADRPTITSFANASGNSGEPGGIPLALAVEFYDNDGSEAHEIWISGIPAGFSLSANVAIDQNAYDSALGVWKLTRAQLDGLKLHTPQGPQQWHQDLVLTATARATERATSQTAISNPVAATIIINAAPTGASLSGAIDENAANDAIVGSVIGIDPDAGDALTYILLNDAGGRFTLTSTGVLKVANGALLNYEAATAHSITVRVLDPRDQYFDTVLTVAVNNVNEANSLPASYGFAVNENVAIGTAVGSVAAGDLDAAGTAFATQRYYFLNGSTVSGTSLDGRYTIDAVTGQIKTASALNFEAGATSVAYTVIARDNYAVAPYNQATSTVTIGINNLNEANSLPTSYAMSVNENVAIGTVVGIIAASDADSSANAYGQQRYYFLNGSTVSGTSSDGRYTIDAVTGQIKTNVALDFETGSTSVAYTVLARDNLASGAYNQISTTVTIGISNLNEANSLPASYAWNVNENVAADTIVGTVLAGDIDSSANAYGQQRYYFWNGSTASENSSDGRYRIDGATGVIRVLGALDYEAGTTSVAYTVIARDNAGAAGYNQVSTTVTIGINNLNEANSLPTSYAWSLNENIAVGTLIGTVAAGDIDSSANAYGQQRYYFWNGSSATSTSSDGRYTIDAVTGQIKTAAAIDFEVGGTNVAYTVVARDNAGAAGYSQASTTVTIGINNLNEANSLPAGYSFGVNENVAVGTTVGTVIAGDIDSSANTYGQQRYYFWNGSSATSTSSDGRYTIDAVTGAIKTAVALNFEAGNTSTTYTVIARDNAGAAGFNQVSTTVTIDLVNQNEAPILTGDTFYRAEQPANPVAPLIQPSWTDPDGTSTNSHVFSIVGGDPDGYWSIDNAGQLFANKALNYEDTAHRAFTLRVRVADQGGLATEADVVVNITNVNEAPNPTANNYSFTGTKPANTLVGIITHNDPDIGDTMSYTITNVFNIDDDSGWTGAYRVASDGNVYTTGSMGGGGWKSRDRITVVVRDATGLEGQVTWTVTWNANMPYPPIVLDLDGDGLDLVSLSTSNVYRDVDGDGVLDRTGWVGADDGLLALDRNGDGIVTDTSELSFAADVPGAISDLEGLRAFDSDQDGFLDADDDQYGSFRLWQDLNQDGISQSGELRTLSEAGIAFINLMLTPTGNATENAADNVVYATGEYGRTDGTTGGLGDVMLAYAPSQAQVAPPIVLDLDGDGVETTELASDPVMFDMDGDGTLDRTGWAGSGDGLLALDRNRDGIVNDISEISFVGDLEGARTDLEGLAAFDSNRDGLLSAADSKFADFRVWIDGNHDGKTDTGELKLLPELGIVSIKLKGESTGDPVLAGRNVVYNTTSFVRGDGTTGKVGDIGLAFVSSKTGGDENTGSNAYAPMEATYERKASKYFIQTLGGRAYVQPRKANGRLDAAAGEISASTLMLFGNGSVGLGAAVVLDLDGDGLELKSRKKAKAAVDMNADGLADDTGWVGKGDGLLVLDRNGNGLIDGAAEMSFQGDLAGADSGMAGLSAFDSNRDGVLDAKDTKFSAFRVWRDANGDGVTNEGELKSLAEHGIAEIALGRRAVEHQWSIGQNIVLATGAFTRTDGTVGTIGDAALAYHRAPPSASSTDSRLALMTQEMAAFGARSGEGEWRGRDGLLPQSFDYFAA